MIFSFIHVIYISVAGSLNVVEFHYMPCPILCVHLSVDRHLHSLQVKATVDIHVQGFV